MKYDTLEIEFVKYARAVVLDVSTKEADLQALDVSFIIFRRESASNVRYPRCKRKTLLGCAMAGGQQTEQRTNVQ